MKRGTLRTVSRLRHQLTLARLLSHSWRRGVALAANCAALKRIQHPHVVRLLDVFTTEKTETIVLECLSGGELFDYLVSRQRLSEREARKFVRQILSALQHCHGLGVIHRDLKLENLLLDGKGNVKVTDFGFSNLKPDDRLCSTFVGSPA
jgi:serine/threonine protein kinase